MKKHEIPKHILNRVEAELLNEEYLLWVGQPHPSRFLSVQSRKTHALLASAIGIEIALLVAALFTASLSIVGLALMALLLTVIAGSIAQQYFWANNTIYAITNQRALIINGNEVETFGKRDLQSIVKKTRSNGRGDIIFRKDTESRMIPAAYGLMLHRQEEMERGFLGIENPNHVELLLLNTFGEKQADTSRLEYQDKLDDAAYFDDDMAEMQMSQQ